ncbi:MAG TPA: hypothetical protein VJP45_10910 [Candidatus Limnocylindria bacterium]|nr:hypothetical protein [Candidatus Limnocylindria bacterium]
MSSVRRVVLALAAAMLLATGACSAAGSGGSGAPENTTPMPSIKTAPTGGPSADPEYGY